MVSSANPCSLILFPAKTTVYSYPRTPKVSHTCNLANLRMKRSSSEVSPSPISSPDQDSKPDITPSKKTKKSPTKPKKETGVKPENGEWDPEKRAVFMDIIIAAGYKAVNLDEIASTVSTTSRRVLMSSWEWERNN
jgi:hypothetical protein